jgi:hypothetical protein
MYNANKPDASELPSTGRLLKSTGIAVVVASALLVTVVLPAEYGVDPTRVGSLLGLTEMGRIKMQLAQEAEAEAGAQPASPPSAAAPATPTTVTPGVASATAGRTDETVITLAPDQGAEIKLVMEDGAKVAYVWSSSGGAVNFDVHADRPGTPYHGYGKGSSRREEGQLVAAFTGSHGWFWRNRTGAPVTITLQTSGAYSEVKRVV